MSQKTLPSAADIYQFIETYADTPQKRADSLELVRLMEAVTGAPPKLWGPSIIGFGVYNYTYASGHKGSAPLLGFSPRKSAISLYVYTGLPAHAHLLADLGTYKMGKACIYIKGLAQINVKPLQNIMVATLEYLKETYGNC